jgi:predicted  nucleic acid-binding Zn-ribbon protein
MDDETRAAFGRMERSFQLMQQEMRAGFERTQQEMRAGFERVGRIEVAQQEGFERVDRIELAQQKGFECVRVELEHQQRLERYDRYIERSKEQHLQLVAQLTDLSERMRTLEAEFRSFRDWATTQFSNISRQLSDIVTRLDRLERQRNGSMG